LDALAATSRGVAKMIQKIYRSYICWNIERRNGTLSMHFIEAFLKGKNL